jgi:hypothetical protein
MYGGMGMMAMPPGGKHPLDLGGFDEHAHKRLMLEHMYQHKTGVMGGGPPGAGAGAGPHRVPGSGPSGMGPPGSAGGFYHPSGGAMAMGPGGMSLTTALRPGMGMPPPTHPHSHMMQSTGPPNMNPGYEYHTMSYQGVPAYSVQYHHQGVAAQNPGAVPPGGAPGGGGQHGAHPPPGAGGMGPGASGSPQQPPQPPMPPHMQGPYGMPPGVNPYLPPQHQPYPPQHVQQQQHNQPPPPHSQGAPSQSQQQQQQQQQHPPGQPHGSQYPNPAATAEIVNAAIAALRYAN